MTQRRNAREFNDSKLDCKKSMHFNEGEYK